MKNLLIMLLMMITLSCTKERQAEALQTIVGNWERINGNSSKYIEFTDGQYIETGDTMFYNCIDSEIFIYLTNNATQQWHYSLEDNDLRIDRNGIILYYKRLK